MQIRMTGVSVADVRFVMAAARAERTREAGVAIVLGIDVTAIEKSLLPGAIDSGRDIPERVRIGIDEAMAGRDIARGADTHQAEARTAGMRFVDALVKLGERVADVRESMQLAPQRKLEVFSSELAELLEDPVHASLADRVQAIRRSRHRREPDLVEPQLMLEVTVDPPDVGDVRSKSHARRDRAGTVLRQQLAHFGRHNIVAAASVREHSQRV